MGLLKFQCMLGCDTVTFYDDGFSIRITSVPLGLDAIYDKYTKTLKGKGAKKYRDFILVSIKDYFDRNLGIYLRYEDYLDVSIKDNVVVHLKGSRDTCYIHTLAFLNDLYFRYKGKFRYSVVAYTDGSKAVILNKRWVVDDINTLLKKIEYLNKIGLLADALNNKGYALIENKVSALCRYTDYYLCPKTKLEGCKDGRIPYADCVNLEGTQLLNKGLEWAIEQYKNKKHM